MKDKFISSIVRNAIIIAIIGVMSYVPYVGYITVGPISITTIHIAVLFFAWMFGWREGLVAGLAFGMFSLFKALSMPSGAIDYLFINPIVSVLPRLLFGFISGLVFDVLRLVKQPRVRFLADVIVVPVMTLFHSLLTLSILYGMYHTSDALSSFSYFQIIGTILTINGAIEIGSATVVVPLLILPLKQVETDNNNLGPILEPDEKTLVETLVPIHIKTIVNSKLLESEVCEQAARCNAMENATNNAKDLLDDLKIEFNKARQGAITQEITEIVSAANAI